MAPAAALTAINNKEDDDADVLDIFKNAFDIYFYFYLEKNWFFELINNELIVLIIIIYIYI